MRHDHHILAPFLFTFATVACGGANSSADPETGSGSSSLIAPASVNALDVAREASIPGNATPFTGSSRDGGGVQAFYDRLRAHPSSQPPGVYHCPADFGVRYRLDFHTDAGGTTTLLLDAGGCASVRDTAGSAVAFSVSDADYTTLANLLGVPESTIYPIVPR